MTTPHTHSPTLLKPNKPVGIVGYGAYVPRFRLPAKEVARVWTGKTSGMPIKEKAVPGLDEDVITMSIEAARNAMLRAQIDPTELRAVWVGSESHPYAVKPTSTLVAEAIGAVPNTQAADWEFACKAGTEALVAAMGLVGSGMGHYAMAIGMDTAQGKPGDALEYTAGAGGGAYILGPAEESLAIINASYSYVTDTPDFWRREYQKYPEHGMRFTGEPAYFKHITEAATHLMEASGTTAKGLQVGGLPSAQHKIPAACRGATGIFNGADRARASGTHHREYLCGRGDDRTDRDSRHCPTRRQNPRRLFRLWGRLRRLRHSRHR